MKSARTLVCTVLLLLFGGSPIAAQQPSQMGEITSNPPQYVLSHEEETRDLPEQLQGIYEFDCSRCSAMKDLLFVAPASSCGNAGCGFYLFRKIGENKYQHLTTVFLHWLAFQILNTEHKGLNDLLIYLHLSASEVELGRYEFDGTSYQAVENEIVSSADLKSRISPEPVGGPTYLSVADIEGTTPDLPASPNSARQLTLIDANDSQMDPILKANFPGLENIDGYQELRRSFLLVRNDTPYNVDAFRIEWDAEAPTESGYSVVGAASFTRDPFQPGPKNQPIAPGGVRLLLEQGGILSPDEWNTPLRDFTIRSIKAAPRRLTSGGKPVVDIVIYADGLYLGADHNLLVPRYQALLDAAHKEGESVLKLLDAGTPVAEIMASLDLTHAPISAGSSPYYPSMNPAQDSAVQYSNANAFQTSQMAHYLQGAFRNGGVGSLRQLATEMANSPDVTLSPLPVN